MNSALRSKVAHTSLKHYLTQSTTNDFVTGSSIGTLVVWNAIYKRHQIAGQLHRHSQSGGFHLGPTPIKLSLNQ
jgi:hypothetical protein